MFLFLQSGCNKRPIKSRLTSKSHIPASINKNIILSLKDIKLILMVLGWRSEGHGFKLCQEPPGNIWPPDCHKKSSKSFRAD